MGKFLALILVLVMATGWSAQARYSPLFIQRLVASEAVAQNRVPPEIALAVAKVESSFRADALSRAGARGVMQIMPATARGEFGVAPGQLWNPRTNVRLGLAFLARLHRHYGGRWDSALSHYNGGSLHNGRPHAYTRTYVDKVLTLARRYKRAGLVPALLGRTRRAIAAPKPYRPSRPLTDWLFRIGD